jgi:BASS family bile acid:Na+ symporter
MIPIDSVHIRFDEEKLLLLNMALAIIMFGVALSIQTKDFSSIFNNPKGVLTGVLAQFVLLPLLTAGLIWIVDPLPSLALGLILVAACPGGNVSNFFSFLGKGNVALSVSLTIIASLAAAFITPYNFIIWSAWLVDSALVKSFDINVWSIARTIFFILVCPLFTGILVADKWPKLAKAIQSPLKYISFMLLIAIIAVAFSNNIDLFLIYYDHVIYLVLLHNGMALLGGYLFSKLMSNTPKDTISITIETGIQNSGLGLVIIFSFFDGNGGMAIITAWWGIWHIISGFVISQVFAHRQRSLMQVSQ